MAHATQLNINNLEEIFSTFNQVSTELEDSYRDLEKQVSQLNRELATARSARLRDLMEKEQLASKHSILMNSLPGGLLVVNKDGNVTQVNPAATETLGRNVCGEHWPDLLEIHHNDSIQQGDITLSNGKRISIRSCHYGDMNERIVLITDITENHELQKQLIRDTRLKEMGEMAARLAHQIRTPLSAAILHLSHIAGPQPVNSKTEKRTNKVQDRLAQIDRLVNSMLSYLNGTVIRSESFCLKSFLTQVVSENEECILRVNGSITLNTTLEHAPFFGNKLELNNAISNIVENALTANHGSPDIGLTLSRSLSGYVIDISDNGPGIDQNILEHIFDPFFSTKCNGTGMGLSIVMSVIKAHKGEVSVVNRPEGGACFHILLPDNLEDPHHNGLWHNQFSSLENDAVKEKNHEHY